MLRPRLVVEENCQLSTSATWSHVPIGGLVKKFTFYAREQKRVPVGKADTAGDVGTADRAGSLKI